MRGKALIERVLLYSILLIGITSCKKDDNPVDIGCQYPKLTVSNVAGSSLFPLNLNNTWTYIDTVWKDNVVEHTGEIELNISTASSLDGSPAIQFNQLLPLITLKNDTLFSTELTPQLQQPNCYRFSYPIFFKSQDSIIVDQIPSVKYVYPSPTTIKTPAGDFSNNIVFNEENVLYITLNPEVGIVKYNLYLNTAKGIRIPRRSLTLKSYNLY